MDKSDRKGARLRSPIPWFGGKGNMVGKLLKLMPPHDYYVEVFGGGASLLFGKEPAKVEVYNDVDEGLAHFFRVLADPELFTRFYRFAVMTPYSRSLYYDARDTWAGENDPVRRAYLWFIVARQSFSGHFGSSWGFNVTKSNGGRATAVNKWQTTLQNLPRLHGRLFDVQIECSDWRKILKTYNAPGYLAYLDPPYVHSTRKAAGYRHEMTDGDHRELVEAVLAYPAMVMLSGYENQIYLPLELAGWDAQRFTTACHAAGRTRGTGILGKGAALRMQPRVECVWRNPAAMEAIRRKTESASAQLSWVQ